MSNKNGVCSKHGKSVKFFKKASDDGAVGRGGFYGCPSYGECGQYYCTRTGEMKVSKKIAGEE